MKLYGEYNLLVKLLLLLVRLYRCLHDYKYSPQSFILSSTYNSLQENCIRKRFFHHR